MLRNGIMLGIALALVMAAEATLEKNKTIVAMTVANTAEVASARDVSTLVKDQRVGVFPLRHDNRFDPTQL